MSLNETYLLNIFKSAKNVSINYLDMIEGHRRTSMALHNIFLNAKAVSPRSCLATTKQYSCLNKPLVGI